MALVSGSVDALVVDTLGAESEQYKIANARVQMYLFLARVGASVVGGWLYMQNATLPFVAYAVFAFLALCVVSTLRESHIPDTKKVHTALFKELWNQIDTSFVVKRVCLGIFLGTFAADMIWIFYQPFYNSFGFSGLKLGSLFATVSLFSAGGAFLVSKFHTTLHPSIIFRLCAVTVVVNALCFLSGNWVVSLIGIACLCSCSRMPVLPDHDDSTE